jgi:hypothetical protein
VKFQGGWLQAGGIGVATQVRNLPCVLSFVLRFFEEKSNGKSPLSQSEGGAPGFKVSTAGPGPESGISGRIGFRRDERHSFFPIE